MGGTLWPRGGGATGGTPLSGVAPASRSTGCESPGSVHGGRGRRWRGGARVGGVAAGRSGSLGLAESGRGRFHLRRSGGASRGVAAVAAAVGRSGPAGRSWWGRPHAVAAAAAVRAVAVPRTRAASMSSAAWLHRGAPPLRVFSSVPQLGAMSCSGAGVPAAPDWGIVRVWLEEHRAQANDVNVVLKTASQGLAGLQAQLVTLEKGGPSAEALGTVRNAVTSTSPLVTVLQTILRLHFDAEVVRANGATKLQPHLQWGMRGGGCFMSCVSVT